MEFELNTKKAVGGDLRRREEEATGSRDTMRRTRGDTFYLFFHFYCLFGSSLVLLWLLQQDVRRYSRRQSTTRNLQKEEETIKGQS